MLLDKAVWQGGVLCELFYPGGFADPDPLSPRSGFERADAVDRRGHLLCSRQTQLPRMPPEVFQRAETVLPDGAERPVYHRLDLAARVPGGELADDAGDGLGLTGLGELLQVREVHPLPAELYGVGASAPRRLPPTAQEVYKRGDGLLAHELAHPFVPDHEIRGTGVLVHEEQRGPDLQRLGDVRRLRGRARGVRGREARRVSPAGQVPDHARYIYPRHTPSILGPDLHRVRPRHHELPPVPWCVVVDSPRERREQRGLAVEPAPGHERDPLRYAHPRDLAPVRQLYRYAELLRALERDGAFSQRPVARPTLPWQHGSIGH